MGCKNGIAKGVALRLRRICSSDEEYRRQSQIYSTFLISRGHKADLVNKEFTAIGLKSRHEVRQKTIKSSPGKAFFVAQFNPKGVSIPRILNKHFSVLRNDPIASKIFPEKSVKVINKRCQNLKELLIRADPYTIAKINNVQLDNTPCGKKCDSCNKFLIHSTSFKCFATGRRFKVQKKLSCRTPYIVYLATCTNCNQQGVGSSIFFPSRLSTYKNHAKDKHDSCGISEHWNHICRHENNPVTFMTFQLIDCVDNVKDLSKKKIDDTLFSKERLWIGTLLTMHHGMNNTHDWNRGRTSWSGTNTQI